VAEARVRNLPVEGPQGPGSARPRRPYLCSCGRSRGPQVWFADGAHLGSGLMLVSCAARSRHRAGVPLRPLFAAIPLHAKARASGQEALVGSGLQRTTQP